MTERVSILAGQLKKVSLSLIIIKKEKAVMALRIRYIICRLITSKIHDKGTQTIEVTC
jgi:hypothetical protein